MKMEMEERRERDIKMLMLESKGVKWTENKQKLLRIKRETNHVMRLSKIYILLQHHSLSSSARD